MSEGNQIDLMGMEIEQLLHFFISVLSTKSVQYLGAPMNKGEEPTKDIGKAKMSIDAMKSMVELVKPSLTEEEQKQLDQVVYSLQMAFVNES